MRVIIFNYETKKPINSISLSTKKGIGDFFSIARRELAALQESDDILGIGKKLFVKDWGFSNFFHKGLVGNSMDAEGSMTCVTGDNSFVYGDLSSAKVYEPKNIVLYNKEKENGEEIIDLKVGFLFYEEGWVIPNGKTNCNIFNLMGSKSYIKSIGSRNIHTNAISGAKIFSTKKAVLNYLEKHKDVLHYCVETYGYHIGIEPTCSYFYNDYNSTLNGKVGEKDAAISVSIASLIDEINNIEEETDGYDDYKLPIEVNEDTIKEEIIYRMKKHDLWDVIIGEYKKSGKIYMSEVGGIIYDLDDVAKIAVEKAIEKGLTPYHVVHTNSEFGDMYNILYVSNDLDNWRYERGRVDGYVYNYCYNSTHDEFEYGESQFINGTGGLTRIA